MTIRTILSWLIEALAAAVVFSLLVAALSGCRPQPELRVLDFTESTPEPKPQPVPIPKSPSKPLSEPMPIVTPPPSPTIQLPVIDWPKAVACAFNAVDMLKTEISSSEPAKKYVMGQTRQLVAFTADWCMACKKMHPVWAALRAEGFDVREVDVDRRPKEYKDFRPLRIPLTALFVDGKFAQQWVGQIEIETLRSAVRDETSTLPTSLGRVLSSPHSSDLDIAAKESSDLQAEKNQQGHHNWDRRKTAIIQTCGYRNVEEICAESWPDQKDADDLTLWSEAFRCWQQSEGHWTVANRIHAAYGRARSQADDGRWFMTILAADGLAQSEPLEQPVTHDSPLSPAAESNGATSVEQAKKVGQPDAGCSGGCNTRRRRR